MDAEIERIREIRDRHSFALLSRPGVCQVGVGWKQVCGKRTNDLAIVVGVCAKMPDSWLPSDNIIPWQLDGVPTDVVDEHAESHVVSARTIPLPEDHKKRWRPAPGGVSVGHYKSQMAGTLGGWFRREDGHVVMLSNWHVIANCGNCKKGDPILQPAILDGGRYPDDVIAYLEEWVDVCMIVSSENMRDANKRLRELLARGYEVPTNKVDMALAKPVSDAVVTDDILGLRRLGNGVADAKLEMRVVMSGRTTGVTSGRCSQVHVDSFVKYPGLGIALFVDCDAFTGCATMAKRQPHSLESQ